MSEITGIGNYYSRPPVTREVPSPVTRTRLPQDPRGDAAEFSIAAEALARAVMESTLRIARTRAIRAEIESNTFVTPERINGTVERLLDVIV